jgi:hypothetical protein
MLRRLIIICVFAFLFGLPGLASAQELKSLVASANGEGTIRLGKEKFKLYGVVVKFLEDGKAELQLITDITVFLGGKWSRSDDAGKPIDFATSETRVEGGGKIFLRDDRKSIASLKLHIFNRISGKNIIVDFVAK